MAHCRNCGQALAEETLNCPACGCPKGMGIGFCENCGEKIIPGTVYCARCGAPAAMAQPHVQPPAAPKKARSRWAAAAFGIVLGCYGVHNFYLGHIGKGLAQIAITITVYGAVCTGSLPEAAAVLLAGLWGFIEGVQIVIGDIKTDADGKALREWNE